MYRDNVTLRVSVADNTLEIVKSRSVPNVAKCLLLFFFTKS